MKSRLYYILFVAYFVMVAFVLYVNGVFTGNVASVSNLMINGVFLGWRVSRQSRRATQ